MKGKKWFCIALGALLALSLGLFAACGNTEEEQQTVAVTSVTVSPATLSLTEGESGTLTATIAPENATDKTVTWSSSDNAVATVENGEVTAVGHGTAVITATAGGVSGSCTVTVNAPTSVWDGTVPAAQPESYAVDADGNVTIGDAAAFVWFAQQAQEDTFAGKTVTLAANIDLDGQEWTPIAEGSRSGNTYSEGDAHFDGTFDGNGLTIAGLKISSLPAGASEDYAVGLFGVVDGGTVRNFTLADVAIDVEASECAGGAVGLLVGGGTAENITVSGSITAGRGNGGVVGRMTVSGTIRGCANNAAVTGTSAGGNTGGIVGAAYYTGTDVSMLIENCTNTGAVTGYVGVGGIVGLSSANVKNCTNSGAVNGNGACVGGIVGEQQNYGAVSDNTNTADVANASESAAVFGTGGIVGWVRYSGTDEAYPLKGIIEVTGNRNSGSVTGGGSAGGIVGHLYNYGLVRENVNTAEEISAQLFASGIVGSLQFEENSVVSALEKDTDVDIVYNASATAATSIAADFTHVYVYNNMTDGATYDRVLEPNYATEEALEEVLVALAE